MRRRTLRQRAGIRTIFSRYKNLEELGKGLIELNASGRLPIPSQKDGICATDAVTASLWYSDILGDYLWRNYIFAKPYQKGNFIVDTRDIEKLPGVQPDKPAEPILLLTAFRVANIIENASVKQLAASEGVPVFRRSESSSYEEELGQPTGEVCSNAARLLVLSDPNRKTSPLDKPSEREGHGLFVGSQSYDRFMRTILSSDDNLKNHTRYCTSSDKGCLVEKTSEKCIAVLVSSKIHATACVLVGGVWTFMDNEMGFGIPFPELTFAYIRDGFFTFSYDYYVDDSKRQHGQYSVTFTSRKSGSVTKTVERKFSKFPGVGRNDHVEIEKYRRYIFASTELIGNNPAPEAVVKQYVADKPQPAPKAVEIRGPLEGVTIVPFEQNKHEYQLSLPKEDPKYAIVIRKNRNGGYMIYSPVLGRDLFLGDFIEGSEVRGKHMFGVSIQDEWGQVSYGTLDVRNATEGKGPSVRGGFDRLYNQLVKAEQIADQSEPVGEEPAPAKGPVIGGPPLAVQPQSNNVLEKFKKETPSLSDEEYDLLMDSDESLFELIMSSGTKIMTALEHPEERIESLPTLRSMSTELGRKAIQYKDYPGINALANHYSNYLQMIANARGAENVKYGGRRRTYRKQRR